jgi:hypothetical protein
VTDSNLFKPAQPGTFTDSLTESCVLVGDCYRGTVEAAPLPKLVDPLVVGIGLVRRRTHDGPGTVDEQAAQAISTIRSPLENCRGTSPTQRRDDRAPV